MKTLRLLTGAALLGLGMLAMGVADQAQAKDFKLTASSSHPPIVPWVAVIKNHVVPEAVKRAKKLGHNIKWTEAYSGTLYNFKNTLEGIQDGLGDIGWVGTLWEPNKMPLYNVTYFAPFVAVDTKNLQEIAEELHAKIPAINKQWAKYNQIPLGTMTADGYVLVSTTPIKTVADLKGKKIYAPGAVARWLEGTGAIAVNGGLPIQYNGIKTGVTQGSILPGTAVLPFKLHEVAPYITLVNMNGSIAGALSMNLKTWNKLPPELQKMFLQLGKEYSTMNTKIIQANRQKQFDILKSKGAKFHTMSVAEQKKWAALLPDIAGEWVKSTEAKGLPAQKVLEMFVRGAKARGETPMRSWGVK